MVFNDHGTLLFSVVGYELIPQKDRTGFALVTDIQSQTIVFNGNFTCFLQKPSMPNKSTGTAKIANKFNINYTIESNGNCLAGHYSYAKENNAIGLTGYKHGDLYYFLETGQNHISSGIFLLSRIDGGAYGLWIGVPPKNPLTVN